MAHWIWMSRYEGNRICIEIIEVHQEKCTQLLVQNVERKLRFPSNQMALDPSIVGNVIRNVDQKDISKRNRKNSSYFFFFIFYFNLDFS